MDSGKKYLSLSEAARVELTRLISVSTVGSPVVVFRGMTRSFSSDSAVDDALALEASAQDLDDAIRRHVCRTLDQLDFYLAVSIVPQEELPASSVTIVDGIPISFAIYPGADSSVVLDYVRNAFQLVDADGRDLMLLLKDYIVKNFS